MGTFFNQEIEALAEEYGLTLKVVNYNRSAIFDREPVPIPKLQLFGLWVGQGSVAGITGDV